MDAEERKLLPKVVDSPEHLNKQLKELDVEFVKEKKRLKEEEREAKLAEVRVKNVGKTVGDVEAATRLVDELMEEEKTYTQILEEVKDIQKEIDENCEEVKLSQEVLSGHEVQLEQIGMLWKIWICQLTLVFSFRHVCSPQYSYLIYNPRIEHETEANRKESKIKIEEVQVALRGVNAQLFAVEKDRRHEKDTLEQNEEDLKVIQTIIDEEQAKAEREIKNILSTYKDMEKIILERQEQFNATIKV
jgi:DNA repair exonuclease SbcCD ATPase subunit